MSRFHSKQQEKVSLPACGRQARSEATCLHAEVAFRHAGVAISADSRDLPVSAEKECPVAFGEED